MLTFVFRAHGNFGYAFWLHFATTVIQIVTGMDEMFRKVFFQFL